MSDTQLQRIYARIEERRDGILRTMRAVDGMAEDKRIELVGEWLRRARTHWRLQNAELYRLNVEKACAMLLCGLLRVGEGSTDHAEQRAERADDLLHASEDRDDRTDEVPGTGDADTRHDL